MKNIKSMSVSELMEYRGEVWKEYFVCVWERMPIGSVKEKAIELDRIDNLIHKRV
jgi:hypothetical protein